MSADETPLDPRTLTAVLYRSLHALDRMERDTTAARLPVVADLVAHAVGLPGWSVFSDGSDGVPRLVLRHLLRPVAVPSERLPVRLGPMVGSFGLHASATTGPRELRHRVVGSGVCEILVAGGYAPDATRWVLECYADPEAPQLLALLPTLYAVVQAALSFPQAARPSAQSHGTRHLALVDPKADSASDAK